jgi:hypothetical protein
MLASFNAIQGASMGVYGRLVSSAISLVDYAANGVTPQLVADFEGGVYGKESAVSTFDNVLNHVRNGNGVVTDANGLPKWAPHNLLSYSQDFTNAAWTKNNTATLAVDATGPDGETSAVTLVDSGAGGAGSLRIERSETTVGSANYTQAIYAKADGLSVIQLSIGTNDAVSGAEPAVNFNLSDGTSTVVSGTTPTFFEYEFESVGDGWYLCSMSYTATTTGVAVTFGPVNSEAADRLPSDIALDGTSSVLIFGAHFYRSDLGGMVNNPNADVGFETYVLTTDAARFLPRENHHVYNGTEWIKEGYLHEPESATNLLLNNGTLSTQNVTVTAEPHTLHFTGSGTITLTGASTAGPLVGTGTGENNRVNLTFTPSAGTLTLTVSGTVTNAQLEEGSVPTSQIPTAGFTVIRAADTLTLPFANIPYPVIVETTGTELFTNPSLTGGAGNSPPTGWSGGGTTNYSYPSGNLRIQRNAGAGSIAQTVTTEIGKVYQVKLDVIATATGNASLTVSGTNGGTDLTTSDGVELSVIFVADATSVDITILGGSNVLADITVNNARFKEIDPLAVSFSYKALVTYADTDNDTEVNFLAWSAALTEFISTRLDTEGSRTGQALFYQRNDAQAVVGSSSGAYYPAINVPMSFASRHGSTFLNGAVDGTALTANTTPTAFPDLSTSDLIIAPSGGPQIIQEFIMWGGTTGDIGDAGTEETSA